ncbi:MAG TPA: PilX N-terminal domain-containing pilus assembly protein [Steroidobacteraceae bacterium]|nr:PilX N-terminal domain-containing pilus assembly protein [Steroidobacteraceae bacterium]
MRPHARPSAERGIVLVTSLLLLVLITILAVSMFRGFGMQERIAGNLREKQRALNAAETAMQYAEWWLTSADNVNLVGTCASPLLNANLAQGMVCQNTLHTQVANVATVPWKDPASGAEFGVAYTGQGMNVNATPGPNTLLAAPRFYISLLGPSATGHGAIYQIDAWGYGASQNAVAVVESTYLVDTGVKDLGAL